MVSQGLHGGPYPRHFQDVCQACFLTSMLVVAVQQHLRHAGHLDWIKHFELYIFPTTEKGLEWGAVLGP